MELKFNVYYLLNESRFGNRLPISYYLVMGMRQTITIILHISGKVINLGKNLAVFVNIEHG